MCGLSDAERELDLYVPGVNDVPFLQETTLTSAQFEKPWVRDRLKSYGDNFKIIPARTSFKIVDSVISESDIVKIDAEGAEIQVLRAMKKIDRKIRTNIPDRE